MRDWTSLFASLGIALVATAVTGPALGSYVLFESGPVRPLALSPDGSRLFAVNTPRRDAGDPLCGGRRPGARGFGPGGA
jgi:hypothetical protein